MSKLNDNDLQSNIVANVYENYNQEVTANKVQAVLTNINDSKVSRTNDITQDIEANKTSITLLSSVKQIYDWATAKFQTALGFTPLNKAGDTITGDFTIGANLVLTGTVNSSLSGSNSRIPSHTSCNITFTNSGLTSIASANNGGVTDGHVLFLTNATGNSITIINNYASASTGEKIYTGAGTNVTIPTNGSFWLRWNTTSNAWLCSASGIYNIQDSQISSSSTWNAKQDSNTTFNRVTSTSYTLLASDSNKVVEMNNSSANAVTVNNSVFSSGNQVIVANYGAGQTSIVAGSGVTIRSAGGALKLRTQYSSACLIFISASEAYLIGDITA